MNGTTGADCSSLESKSCSVHWCMSKPLLNGFCFVHRNVLPTYDRVQVSNILHPLCSYCLSASFLNVVDTIKTHKVCRVKGAC